MHEEWGVRYVWAFADCELIFYSRDVLLNYHKSGWDGQVLTQIE